MTNGNGDDDFDGRRPAPAGRPPASDRKTGRRSFDIATKRPAQKQLVLSSLDRACLRARAAADNKARDVVVLDMRGITPLYDFFVLATGTSRRQIHTIAEEIDAALRDEGDRRLAIEGYEASKWVVQDYGDVVVHVFDPDTREYYALEDLWADAPRVDWERSSAATPSTRCRSGLGCTARMRIATP